MADIFEKAIVQKQNILNELRSNNLTLQELRFFSIYLSKINPRDISTRAVRFKLSDFKKIMDFKKLNIVQLRAATNRLLGKVVNVPKESGGYFAFQLFKECDIDKDELGEWYITIDAHDKALPLMFDFKDKYFKYELWNALRLKSANQVRMYEILKQYETIGKRELKVSDLRELLGISPNEYPRWNNFKDRVLDSCQRALKQFTDICFTYDRGKTGQGGKWLTIIFTISKNNEYDGQMTMFETELRGFIDLDAIKMETAPEKNIEPDSEFGDLGFYSSACSDEFTTAQMESIMQIVNQINLPPHEYGASIAKYHFLLEHYSRFKAVAESTDIKNRYSYFYAMVKAERDRLQGGDNNL